MHYSSPHRMPVRCWPFVCNNGNILSSGQQGTFFTTLSYYPELSQVSKNWKFCIGRPNTLFYKFALHLPSIDHAELGVWQEAESHKRLANSKRNEIELSILHILSISDFACLSLAWKIQSSLLPPLKYIFLILHLTFVFFYNRVYFPSGNLINVLIWHVLLLYLTELQCNWQRTLWNVKKFKCTALTNWKVYLGSGKTSQSNNAGVFLPTL